MNPNLNQSRTPLLAALRKAFCIASASTKKNAPPVNEIIEIATLKHRERRRFISDVSKAGIALGASVFLRACKKANDVAPAFKQQADNFFSRGSLQPKIVIIGAGMAGLNCAYQLKKPELPQQFTKALQEPEAGFLQRKI